MAAWNADELGMTPDDHRWLAFDIYQHGLGQRWKALKALWCAPIVDEVSTRRRTDGVIDYIQNRGEDWTLMRAIRASIGLILGLSPRHDPKTGNWHRWWDSLELAFWDNHSVYGGYTVDVLQLIGWFGVECFNDGETCL